MRAIATVFLLALAACQGEPSPQQQTPGDAADVATAEAAQEGKAPAPQLALQPLSEADSAQAGLEGAGCSFAPTGQERAVLMADLSVAVIKAQDMTMTFAVDGGSAKGVQHYVGKTHTARIEHAAGPGEPWGDEGASWQAVLTVQDPDHREVYRAAGTFVCSA